MKKYLLLLVGLCALFVPAIALHAQDAAPVPVGASLPADASNVVLAILLKLAASHPWIATLITVIGSMRVWAKPVFSIVHQVIEITPGKMDDDLWAKGYDFFTKNPVGQAIAYGLDWFASIKITPPGAEPRAKPADQ